MSEVMVALDFSEKEEINAFLNGLERPIYVKLGMELIYAQGWSLIDSIRERGHKIFLDLKLHDIPHTVFRAMRNLAKRGVDMVNLHAAGGSEMMRAAVEGLQEGAEGNPPLCIAVTQLTSTSEQRMHEELLIPGKLEDVVQSYACLAKESGLDGVVCSVHEAKKIHQVCGEQFLTVTPGIRLAEDSSDDQKRVATPLYAKEQGCDYLVVGRSITQSRNPWQTYCKITDMLKDIPN